MRIRVAHTTRYEYDRPARSLLQIVRMTPRDHDGQHVVSWRVEPSAEGKLKSFEDAFGNACLSFEADEPVTSFSLTVSGDVETTDTAGVVSGTVERLPDPVFLRETDLTAPDGRVRDLARSAAAGRESDRLATVHALLGAVREAMRFETGLTDAATTAAQALEAGHGVCQDLTHVFLSAARHLGVPARYVSGYFRRADGVVDQEAGHAWAEARIPGLGWVGFDPANGISTTDAHIRVATGLDYLSAAPIRGSRRGGGVETLDVSLRVATARRQRQE